MTVLALLSGLAMLFCAAGYWFMAYAFIHNRGEDAHIPYDGLGRQLVWKEGMEKEYFARFSRVRGFDEEDVLLDDATRHTAGQLALDCLVFLVLLGGGGYLLRLSWRMESETPVLEGDGGTSPTHLPPSSPRSRKDT